MGILARSESGTRVVADNREGLPRALVRLPARGAGKNLVRPWICPAVSNMDGRRLRLRDMRSGGRSVRLADLERDERMPIQTGLFSLAA